MCFVVYLKCFCDKSGRPTRYPHGKRPGHYCGIAWGDPETGDALKAIERRDKVHRSKSNRAARLLVAVLEAGLDWQDVQFWTFEKKQEAYDFERWLKDQHGLSRFCPLCKEIHLQKRRERRAARSSHRQIELF